MGLSLNRSKTTTILLSFSAFILILPLLLLHHNTKYHKIKEWASLYYLSILALLGLVLVIGLGLVAAARATMVTCITVLVLLTFAGNRRRVLVKRGKRIINDVAMFFVGVLVKEKKGFVAVACATVFSIMAVIGFSL